MSAMGPGLPASAWLEMVKLPGRISGPPAMRNLAATPAALRFLRRASAEIDSPEGWEALHRFLDEQQRKEP